MSLITMSRHAPRWRAALGSAVLCALSSTTELTAQAIKPVFAWPAGSSATIVTETTAEGLPDSAAARVPRRTTSSYQIGAHPAGLLIGSELVSIDPPLPKPSADMPDIAAMMGRSAGFIVRRDGRFVGYADTAMVKRRMDSLAFTLNATLTARTSQLSPQMDAIVTRMQERTRTLLTLERTTETARRAWEALAFEFSTRRWTPGDSAIYSFDTPNPVNARGSLPLVRVVRYVGTVACPGGAATRCWKFSARQAIEPAAMAAATRESMRETMAATARSDAMRQRMMAMIDTMPLSVPENVTSTETIVDAATLLPLRVESIMRIGMGPARTAPVVTRTVANYTWKR